jgi:hypothetical protein
VGTSHVSVESVSDVSESVSVSIIRGAVTNVMSTSYIYTYLVSFPRLDIMGNGGHSQMVSDVTT